jgi:GNAT superfamily N-acetyltransferase
MSLSKGIQILSIRGIGPFSGWFTLVFPVRLRYGSRDLKKIHLSHTESFFRVDCLESTKAEYRIATVKDIDDIVSLWNESRLYHEELDSRLSMVDNADLKVRDYYHEQLTSEDAMFYIASGNGVSIGYVCAQIQKASPVHLVQRFGLVDGLFVRSNYRRMGVGTGLFGLAKEWFRKRGITLIQLSVASRNQVGVLFRERCGFTEIMRRMRMQL